MIAYKDVIKKSQAYNLLRQDILSDRLAHSYMFICDDKATLYSYLTIAAELIFCPTHDACGKCNICERIESDNYTNITTLKSDTAIKVEDIKEMIDSTYMTAMEGGTKLYIIADGEKMNESSQNKLLKTLEEPNADVIILIGTSNENSMLQTIRSRCKKVRLNIWNGISIAAELSKLSDDSERIRLATEFSADNITRATSILGDDDFYQKYTNVMSIFDSYKGSSDIANYLNIFGTEKDEVITHLNIMEGVVNSMTHQAVRGEQHGIYSPRILSGIYDIILDSYKRLNANCNVSNTVYSLLMRFAEAKYVLA